MYVCWNGMYSIMYVRIVCICFRRCVCVLAGLLCICVRMYVLSL